VLINATLQVRSKRIAQSENKDTRDYDPLVASTALTGTAAVPGGEF
jgi:hypothetical protein